MPKPKYFHLTGQFSKVDATGIFLTMLFCCQAVSGAGPSVPTYWQDIRPLFRKNCTVCHSARNLKELDVSGGLALDSYESIRKGRPTKTPVVSIGKSSTSRLVKRLVTDEESRRMPQAAPPLSPEAIAVIRSWIDTGLNEGAKPKETSALTATTNQRRARKLHIIVPTNAVPTKEIIGSTSPTKLDLDLSVGPPAPVAAVRFSPDGKLLATGSYGAVTIWAMEAAQPLTILTNLLGAVNDLQFSSDGKLLAVAGGQPSARGDVRIFQVADWKLVASLGGHMDVVFSVAFHPDGKHLASASFDKTVRLWNLDSHKVEHVFTHHSDFVYGVAFSPDGKRMISCSKDRSVKLVDPTSGKSLLTLSGMDQDVMAIACSPDGKFIVSSGFESSLYWWNATTGERIRTQGGHGVAVHEICFSKDGKWLVSAGADSTVRLWNGTDGAHVRAFSIGSVVYATTITADGKRVASGSFDGLVRLWDAGTGRELVRFLTFPAFGCKPEWLALTPEGYLVSSPGVLKSGQWRMSGQPVVMDKIWKTLGQRQLVAKAARGEHLAPPSWK